MPRIRRSGRPGLLSSIGRTAIIAGTPTMTTGVVRYHPDRSATGQQDLAEQQNAAAFTYSIPKARDELIATPLATAEPHLVERLSVLVDLRISGQLTEEEFSAAKAQLLL